MTALATALWPLQETLLQLGITGVDVYYRSTTDMALIGLRLPASGLTIAELEQIHQNASQAGAAVLDAQRLPDDSRSRFLHTYLPLYDLHLADLPSLDHALRSLQEHREGAPVASGSAPNQAIRVEVRFRRGDEWRLARVRNLTREGIAVVTGTPPRRNDVVELELAAGDTSVLLRSAVVGVTSDAAGATLGATGFGARFLAVTEEERRSLERIVVLVGDGQTVEPPPRRRDDRYPLCWPVVVRTQKLRASLRALDVSRHGLFVAAEGGFAPPSGPVHLTVPIDDRGTPVMATARVARSVPELVARTRGMSAGVGLELTSLSTQDEHRFARFVGRVGRRANREIVVGASIARLDDITAALVAAGYCASGFADAPTLVTRSTANARKPDLVVLDASLGDDDPRALATARRALGVRMIPMLSVDGQSAGTAREWVDGALLQ